ncbi:hypothetical protein [Hoyosella subflava]|uniref:Uncharacterized protein n=1 Tax=Hoyosella subflava (strain DSM 45089 / JCM 17490 / NBRC 109087 / DQS3-9A1) TaxID=443218 RepID=F6EQE2_HOYSD|nr:hypothetical protein [Hoyosella subflava]AEF40627.1 hypothetical protein AS9A_2178 [Hoyosella subflava DQS3-9A1]
MVSTRTFTSVVLAAGAAPALILSAVNGFFPTFTDISDPFGRPSLLSAEIVESAQQLDKLAAVMEPKHERLASDIQALGPMADELTVLAGTSLELSSSAAALTLGASTVRRSAEPLPGVVADVTARGDDAGSTVAELSMAVGSVTTELQEIHNGLAKIHGTLGTLGPKVSGIAVTMAAIQEEASRVKVFGPLLAVIGPPINSLGLPPLGFEAPPLPPLPESWQIPVAELIFDGANNAY